MSDEKQNGTEMAAAAVERGAARPPGGVGDLGVSARQERVIGLLAVGRSATEAAAEVGLSRGTVYRWLREDAAFIAAYNAWRREASRSARGRMRALSAEAVDAVAQAVRGGDGRLALQLLKALGLAAAEPDGPEDADEVKRQQKLDRLTARIEADCTEAGLSGLWSNCVARREAAGGEGDE